MKRRRGAKRTRKRGKRRRGGTARVARVVRSVVSRATETKWNEVDFTTSVVNTVGSAFLINGMVQGDSRRTRTANRIELKYLRATFTVEPSAAAVLATRVRCMLVMDKQPNGAAFAGADLFPPNILATDRFFADYNMNTIPRRFKVMWDKLILLRQGVVGTAVLTPVLSTTTSIAQQPVYFRKRFKLKSKTRYNELNTGLIDDIITPSLYFIFFSSQGATQAPTVFCRAVLQFKDA